jgi:hypothetical protein
MPYFQKEMPYFQNGYYLAYSTVTVAAQQSFSKGRFLNAQ